MSRIYIQNLRDELIITDKTLHYLLNVVKKTVGDEIVVFDGKTGEFIYQITQMNKKQMVAKKIMQKREFLPCLDVWLLFCPLKKDATDFVIEKATELGVKKIVPVISQRVNNHNFNQKRAVLQAIEAAEQCERLDIVEIDEPIKLADILKKWPEDRALMPLLERENAQPLKTVLEGLKTKKVAFLVGPEGGFDEKEKSQLKSYLPASLGQRILRAETACLAAIASYQLIKGDFN